MDMSHDHTDFGPQITFLGSEGLFFAFLTAKSTYFLHLYKISDRLMTYFIFEPISVQPRDLAEYSAFLDFLNWA
jgi:hypothetical protein